MKIGDDIQKNPGVYAITCELNKKCYIGRSKNCHARAIKHRTLLRNNAHSNSYLQNAWNKYGEHNFTFKVLEYCKIEKLDELEEKWIHFYSSNKKEFGYNIRIVASSNIGVPWTEEHREKMNKIVNDPDGWFKNHTISENTRKRQHEVVTGMKWTDEQRKKHSLRMKGVKTKDTTNMKIAQTGEKNGAHKLSTSEVIEIINLLRYTKYPQEEIAKTYNVQRTNISLIQNNKSWKNIDRKTVLSKDILQKALSKMKTF